MAIPEGLLEAVRNYLDISWSDDAGDTKLTGIIARGMKYLDATAGKACDYTVEDKPRELLFEYCRYARSNALDEFQKNYLHELSSLQLSVEIAERIAKTSLAALSIGELTLTPTFSAGVYEYEAETENDSDIITVTTADRTAVVVITVSSAALENGAAAAWATGENVVIITVTYGEFSLFYTVIVTR